MDRLRPLCPYLDRRDARCSDLLTLMNLNEAFRLCAGNHELCTLYHQIRTADFGREREPLLAQSA